MGCTCKSLDPIAMVMGVSSLIFVRVDTPAVLSRCSLSSSSRDLNVMHMQYSWPVVYSDVRCLHLYVVYVIAKCRPRGVRGT